jgi:rubrerythrin
MDEYISKNDLLDVIGVNIAEAHNERCSQLLEAILNAPSADVTEVRHGEWLKRDLFGKTIYNCSECDTIGSPVWKRCPVCEAKMDGRRDT